MVSMPKASFQVGCEVKFSTDLPNGPYGEMTGAMSGAIHVPPNSSYQSVKEAILTAAKTTAKHCSQPSEATHAASSATSTSELRARHRL